LPYIEKDFPIEDINELAVREVNARKPVYLIHKWWARRPGPTFRAIILATFLEEDPMKLYYSRVNHKDKLGYTPVIFDPFMGGGTTVVEAVRLGVKTIGIDLNPVAWFITKKEIEPINPKSFKETAEAILKSVGSSISQYYKTLCPSKNKHEADIIYALWVRQVKCENCKKEVPLFKNFLIASVKKNRVVFCPKCGHVFKTDSKDSVVICPECQNPFDVETGYVEGKMYKCPHCSFRGEVSQAIKKTGKPSTKLFAIEYYCPECDERGYKKVEPFDVQLFERAKEEYESKKDQLLGRLIPEQAIPWDTMAIRRAQNSVYKHFYDLFNERQLLCLAKILEKILQIEDENLREYFLLTFSDCTNANNMMCKYNYQAAKLEPLFGHHTIWAPQMPVENNILGTKYGRGSFKNYIEKALKGLKYCQNPYEISFSNDRKIEINGEYVKAKVVENFEQLMDNSEGVLLLSVTSENIKEYVPEESVDAVITDPPYYDNVMYSEVSNFFYVWLRLGLKDKYPEQFAKPLIDNRREIVVNTKIGKDPDFYVEAMKRCMIEAHRVLKKGGILAMTFHHSSPEAWAAVLKFLVESGFIVIGAYPIHSETRSGVHPGIEYDSIIVCKKVEESRLPAKPLPKAAFEAEVRNRVEADADRFVEKHPRLSIEDLYVAVMGRAIQILSENYAVTLKTGRTFTLKDFAETLKDLGDIAFDVLLKKLFAKTPEVDRVSKIYAAIFAREKYVSFDTIDKVTKLGGVDFSLFEAENLIGEKKGSAAKIVEPEDRINWIERKLERGQPLLYIDSAQMLRLAWSKGKIKEAITKYVKNGIEKEKLENYIKFLAERTGDVEWARIAKALAETPVASLEKWLP